MKRTRSAIDNLDINFRVGGGKLPASAGVGLICDGEEMVLATGFDAECLTKVSVDVSRFKGRKARLVLFDFEKGSWGHVNADDFTGSDGAQYSLTTPTSFDGGFEATAALYDPNSPRKGTGMYHPAIHVHDPWLENVEGTIHLFHLDQVYHATSTDGVHWKPLGKILSTESFTSVEKRYHDVSPNSAWTGCTVYHNGKLYLFWTANKMINGRRCNRTCVTISSDGGKTWQQHADNPIIVPDPRWYDTENDPAPEYTYHAKPLMDWRDIAIVQDLKTGLFHG